MGILFGKRKQTAFEIDAINKMHSKITTTNVEKNRKVCRPIHHRFDFNLQLQHFIANGSIFNTSMTVVVGVVFAALKTIY